MQDTELIFDPAANCAKFLMIVIGMIMHTVVINVTAMIMTAIMQVILRIVPDFLALTELRMTMNLYAFVLLILVVPSMTSSLILMTILPIRVKMHVIGSAKMESADAGFGCVPAADHVVLYLLVVPRYLIATVRMIR